MASGSYWQKHKAQIGNTKITGDSAVFRIDARAKSLFEEGKMILLDKPLHWTSFDVVRKIRNMLGIKKVGHAGTLDPLATGLLILCTGKFTKHINQYMAAPKEYLAGITLGTTTATYDLESTPENLKDFHAITQEMLTDVLLLFEGEISQVPPIYSAIKKNGVAAYELARRGDDVKLQPRLINIYAIELLDFNPPVFNLKIACSTGTYIRSLAHDIGQQLNCGAHLSSLRRTKIGEFDVSHAVTPEVFLQELIRDSHGENHH